MIPRSLRLDRLRIRHLRLLEFAVEVGTLTGAATALGISQPAATKMLKELEAAFDCVLLDRTTRGGSISVAGELVLGRLRVALGMLEAANQEVDKQPHTPLLRIGILRFAGVQLIPELVAHLYAKGKLPRLQLHEGTASELMGRLRAGDVDCVIGRLELGGATDDINAFEVVPLTDEPYEVACSPTHPLAAESQVPWTTLQDYPWIMPPLSTYTWSVFETGFRRQGMLAPRLMIESPSFHDSFAILAKTDFLSIAPRSAVAYYQALGRVSRVDLLIPYAVDYAVLVALKSTMALPAMQLVRDALSRISAEHNRRLHQGQENG